MPPPLAPPSRLVEAVLPSFLPAVPALGVVANVAVCLTGAAELGVDVAGPSLPVCPLVVTMVSLFQSSLKVCQNLY